MDGLPGFDPTQPHTDEEYDAALRAASAQEAAKEQGTSFLERIGQGQQQVTQGQSAAADSPIGTFIRHIPQNVGVGVLDGALTAADKLNSVEEWWGTPTEEQKQALADPSLHAPALPEHPPVPVFSAQALDALRTWRKNIAPEGDNISDALTQGLAQFAIPFAGFAKVFGLSARVGVISNLARGTAADIAATVTAIPSHTQRGLTELLELGRQAENKFGEVLRTVAPDDGLITRYINWMNDTTNEGTLEGEFKNSLDTLSLGLATSGLMKTAATTFKLSLHLPEYVGQNLGPGPVGRGAQRGSVSAGTPAPASFLYRGVEPGVDPTMPRNRAGALFYTPKAIEAHDYGSLVHRSAKPEDAFNAGSLPDFLQSQGVDPKRAGHQDALMEALSNYAAKPDAKEWLRFSYPLPGNPEEYVRFPALTSKK